MTRFNYTCPGEARQIFKKGDGVVMSVLLKDQGRSVQDGCRRGRGSEAEGLKPTIAQAIPDE